MHHLVLSINAGNSLRVGRSKLLNQSIVPKILNIQTHPRGSGAIKVYLLREGGAANIHLASQYTDRVEKMNCAATSVSCSGEINLPLCLAWLFNIVLGLKLCCWRFTPGTWTPGELGTGGRARLPSPAIGIRHKLLMRSSINDKCSQMQIVALSRTTLGTIIIFLTVVREPGIKQI